MKNKSRDIDFKQAYLLPFVREFISLATEGITWFSMSLKCFVTTQFFVYCMNCDSVMKPYLLCIKGHSGYHSCPLCIMKGSVHNTNVCKPAEKDENNKLVIYPLRPTSKADITFFVAKPNPEDKLGHKDVPVLEDLPFFTSFLCTSIDMMHAIDLGVFKKMFKIIFCTKRYKYIKKGGFEVAEKVMGELNGISFIERGPRTLAEYKNWKASEWHYWGFFYSIPIMDRLVTDGLMDFKHFSNWMNLLVALSLLNSENISDSNLTEAQSLMDKFVLKFVELYGKGNASLNFHLLVHVRDSVRHLGPLWATTLYPFESYNQVFLNCFRQGTKGVEMQIAERLQWRHRAVEIYDYVVKHNINSDIDFSLAERVWAVSHSSFNTSGLGKPCTFLSINACKNNDFDLNSEQYRLVKESLLNKCGISDARICVYDRVKFKGVVYWTESYFLKKQGKKNESIFYSQELNTFGVIDRFIEVNNEMSLVFRKLNAVYNNVNRTESLVNSLLYAKVCKRESVLSIINMNMITCKCMGISTADRDSGKLFVFRQQNRNDCK